MKIVSVKEERKTNLPDLGSIRGGCKKLGLGI